MSEFMPGPWFVETDDEGQTVVLAPDGGDTPWNVALIYGSCGYFNDTSVANARLIAAAPDLFVALTNLLEAIGGEESSDIWCADARAALAKAKG